MVGLKEFILQQVADEERLAQLAMDGHGPAHEWCASADPADCPHIEHWSPWRVMSGCLSKRLIIAAHRATEERTGRANPEPGDPLVCSICTNAEGKAAGWPCYTLRVLALDYVDSPRYRPEWRPRRLHGLREN